jgi:hypothetical protein
LAASTRASAPRGRSKRHFAFLGIYRPDAWRDARSKRRRPTARRAPRIGNGATTIREADPVAYRNNCRCPASCSSPTRSPRDRRRGRSASGDRRRRSRRGAKSLRRLHARRAVLGPASPKMCDLTGRSSEVGDPDIVVAVHHHGPAARKAGSKKPKVPPCPSLSNVHLPRRGLHLDGHPRRRTAEDQAARRAPILQHNRGLHQRG